MATANCTTIFSGSEDVCLNRAARLTRLAGVGAQIGYKRRPGKYGGKPSVVVDNTLDRQFDMEAPDEFCDETMSAIMRSPTTALTCHGFFLHRR